MSDPRDGRWDYLELPVGSPDDLVRTRDFLQEVFGWEHQMWGDGYADTHGGGLTSGISAADHASAVPLPVVYSDDLEGLRDRVSAAGGEVTLDIFPFPGGRRFHFREPSGNEMAAWTEDAS